MLAKAEIDSVVVTDAEVDANTQRRMDLILAQSGRTPDELEELYGKPLEQIRLELRDQIREQLIVSRMESKITEGLEVTPAEVKRFFNRIPKDSLPYFSASVEVAQIVKLAEHVMREVEEVVRHFPRYHKYQVGADLRDGARDVARLAHRAWRDSGRKVQWIQQLVFAVDDLKLTLQLSKEVRAFKSFAQFEALARTVSDLGRQCGGWQRQSRWPRMASSADSTGASSSTGRSGKRWLIGAVENCDSLNRRQRSPLKRLCFARISATAASRARLSNVWKRSIVSPAPLNRRTVLTPSRDSESMRTA